MILNCSYNIGFNYCGLPFGITKCYRKDVELFLCSIKWVLFDSVVLVNICILDKSLQHYVIPNGIIVGLVAPRKMVSGLC